MPVSVVSVATGEVVSLEEIRQYVQVPEASDNALLQSLRDAAVAQTQEETRRKLLTHTVRLWLDRFPRLSDQTPSDRTRLGTDIILPFPPLKTVTEITYIDSDGVKQTIDAADYLVDTANEPGRVRLAEGCQWPMPRLIGTADHPWPVKVEFTCGFGTLSTQIPATYRTIVKAYIKLWFDMPNPVENSGAQPVIMPMHTQSMIGLVKDQTEYPKGVW